MLVKLKNLKLQKTFKTFKTLLLLCIFHLWMLYYIWTCYCLSLFVYEVMTGRVRSMYKLLAASLPRCYCFYLDRGRTEHWPCQLTGGKHRRERRLCPASTWCSKCTGRRSPCPAPPPRGRCPPLSPARSASPTCSDSTSLPLPATSAGLRSGVPVSEKFPTVQKWVIPTWHWVTASSLSQLRLHLWSLPISLLTWLLRSSIVLILEHWELM